MNYRKEKLYFYLFKYTVLCTCSNGIRTTFNNKKNNRYWIYRKYKFIFKDEISSKPDCSGRKDGVAGKLGYILVGSDLFRVAKKPPDIACSSRARNSISPPYFLSLPSSTKMNSV